MMLQAATDILRMILGAVVAGSGVLIIFGASIGLLRFPDFYTRLHAASASDGPGAILVVVGFAILAPDLAVALRLALLAALVAALSPITAHLLGAAAHAGGLAPIVGRYAAHRPDGVR